MASTSCLLFPPSLDILNIKVINTEIDNIIALMCLNIMKNKQFRLTIQ